MMQEFRKDALTAQKVDTGVIFKSMLGSDDARAYLHAENVPAPVIERVLGGSATRLVAPGSAAVLHDQIDLSNIFYCHSGRRRDTVRAAVVKAAVTVARDLGRERAERLLRREGLSEEVIARVLADDGSRRARSAV